ncbi:hypothetical protein [Peribacillus simplex]|uniref:hypothetical protein n=1 Tax=Peribacillus simplex TaxID=1478 RepID=UPI003D2C1438
MALEISKTVEELKKKKLPYPLGAGDESGSGSCENMEKTKIFYIFQEILFITHHYLF